MIWHLTGAPWSVQVAALECSAGHDRYGYFMEMGLGKTAVTINDFIEYLGSNTVDGMLVLSPNTLKTTVWRDGIRQWAPALDKSVCVWPYEPTDKTQVFVMNYEAALHRGGVFAYHFLQKRRIMLILEEGHRVKNHQAKTTRWVHSYATHDNVKVVRELTGTPMTQSVMDLWPQLRLLGQLRGVNPYAFRNRFAVMGGYMGKQVLGVKKDMLPELTRLLDSCSFRAKLEDWTDIPKKIYMPAIEFAMTPAQQKMYEDMWEDFMVVISNQEEVKAPMVITQLMKLQQISRGFLIRENGAPHSIMAPGDNPAVKALVEALESINRKALVFTHFRYSTEIVYSALKAEGFDPAIIMGQMEDAEPDAEIFKFNNDPHCRVAVVQAATGSLGITLLGKESEDRCAATFFYENTYSLTTRAQAEGRNHRIGQDQAVTYTDLVCSPVDKALVQALQKKQDLVASVIDIVRARPVVV